MVTILYGKEGIRGSSCRGLDCEQMLSDVSPVVGGTILVECDLHHPTVDIPVILLSPSPGLDPCDHEHPVREDFSGGIGWNLRHVMRDYPVHTLRNPQNPAVSPGNLDGYDRIRDLIE